MATITVKGSTFPSSPSTDQIFYKTDAFSAGSGAWCSLVTDSDAVDHWVTTYEYKVTFPQGTLASSDATAIIWVGDDNAFYFSKFIELRTFVDTTNDTDNSWTLTYYAVQLDGTTQSFATINTGSQTPNTYYDRTAVASPTLLTGYGGFYIDISNFGSPGPLTYAATIPYKLVIST